jgi:hypothetical protein
MQSPVIQEEKAVAPRSFLPPVWTYVLFRVLGNKKLEEERVPGAREWGLEMSWHAINVAEGYRMLSGRGKLPLSKQSKTHQNLYSVKGVFLWTSIVVLVDVQGLGLKVAMQIWDGR